MPTPDKYRIGIRVPGTGIFQRAFDIRRADDGSVHISKVRDGVLTPDVKKRIIDHLGQPQQGLTGGVSKGKHYTALTTEQPGSKQHFDFAVHSLPEPFGILPRNAK